VYGRVHGPNQRIRGVYDYALYKSTFYLLTYLLTYGAHTRPCTYTARLHGRTGREHGRVHAPYGRYTIVYKAMHTVCVYRRVHGLYTAVYTAVYADRVHGRVRCTWPRVHGHARAVCTKQQLPTKQQVDCHRKHK